MKTAGEIVKERRDFARRLKKTKAPAAEGGDSGG